MIAPSKNWLLHFLDKAGSNPNRLASALGANRQTIYKLVKRAGPIPSGWADQIAPILSVPPYELMFGPGALPEAADVSVEIQPVEKPIAALPVGGTVAAGMWIAEDYVDNIVYDPIPAVLHKYPDVPQQAWKVSGPSMDLVRIFDGDYVITVPYWEARAAFQDNDIVVVEAREPHRFERTCKQIVVRRDTIELWPRSSHPNFKTPLIVPKRREEIDDEFVVEIVGLVIGRATPM